MYGRQKSFDNWETSGEQKEGLEKKCIPRATHF